MLVMDNNLKYDKSSPESIEYYALNLEGHTFNEVLDWNLFPEFDKEKYKGKGNLGTLIEEHYFGYSANSNQEADFSDAGVELKVTPFKKLKNGQISAKERLVITMISYEEPVEEDFKKSHVWEKGNLILLIYYFHNPEIKDNKDFEIKYVKLFDLPEEDLEIIEQDYKTIISKVKNGEADLLSEGETMYLGACTKGATRDKSTVSQKYYAPDKLARKRAFCFKTSYMTYILRNYILKERMKEEAIVSDTNALKKSSFEKITIDKINKYAGMSLQELCNKFNVENKINKATWNTVAFRMLGIKSNKAKEFEKAQIILKTIRIEENGKIRESMSFPNLNFIDFAHEENWENSDLYDYLSSTKFLFVIYKRHQDKWILKGAQYWNMPSGDLEIAGEEWEKYHDTVCEGIHFEIISTKSGNKIVKNNLPNKKDMSIIHIRPHTQKTYYVFKNGETLGNGGISNSDLLPNGERMTKQSFWLNNDYVLKQIDEKYIK